MPEKQPPKADRQSDRSTPYDYQDMLMNAPMGIFISTPDGRFVYTNKALARIFGYDSPRELIDATGDIWADIYADPEDREGFKRLLRQNKGSVSHECRFVRRSGFQFWASCHVRAVRGKKGDITYYQGFLTDITERKQERESLLRTQFAMDKAPDSILWVDDEACIIYANDAACASMGYTREELLTMTAFDIDPDFRPEKWEEHKEEVQRLGTMLFESRHRTKDGRLFPVEVSTNHFKCNKRYLACAFDRDITERKRTEAAVKESEAHFRMLFKMAPLPMAHISLDGRILDLNNRLTEVMGYTTDDVPTLEHAWALSMPDPDLRNQIIAEWRTDLERAVVQGADMEPFECPLLFKDGTMHTVVIGTKLIADSIIVNFFDITERKQAEAEREKLQAQLLQSQKLEAIGILAGGVAHDFNNMLGVITGYAELTLSGMEPSDPFRKNLEKILDAGRRSANLTRQLLAFARRQTIAPIILDLNESVEAILKMMRRIVGENIELVWLPGQGSYRVKMDTSQLDQVLVNLCVNARDAIGDVGRVTIETATVSLDEACHEAHSYFIPGEYVLLVVSDDGCGMDRETLNHIFEPFFTTKGVGRGTGMGLATVYGIVKQNQGFINVYSEPGEGTTFRIYVPQHSGGVMEAKAAMPEDIPLSRGETILIVEDDPTLLEMSTVLLQRLGYTVIPAATPNDAIRTVQQANPEIHLFITDVIMPEMNGRDLADRLLAIRPKMKHLFMSGYTANVIAHQGILDKGVNFLQKPFSVKDMAARVRDVLG